MNENKRNPGGTHYLIQLAWDRVAYMAPAGGSAITVLEPNTTYQLRYRVGVNQVTGFMVSVFTDSASQGINTAGVPGVRGTV